MRPVSATDQVPPRDSQGWVGSVPPQAGCGRWISGLRGWLPPHPVIQIEIEICRLVGAEMRPGAVRIHSFGHAVKVHDGRARRTRHASHRIDRARAPACRPGIPTHETKSQPYRPGRGGHNVGPCNSARGTTTKTLHVYGALPSRARKVHRGPRIQGDQVGSTVTGRQVPAKYLPSDKRCCALGFPSGSRQSPDKGLAEPTSEHGRRCTGRALVSSGDRGLPWARDNFRDLID